jgi:hypothetical protein
MDKDKKRSNSKWLTYCFTWLNFFNSHSGGVWVEISPLGTSATTGLLYLPRVIVMMMENLVEWRLAGETEVLGENLPQRHFIHHKSHLPDPGSNPGRRCGKSATNRLSYGAAFTRLHFFYYTSVKNPRLLCCITKPDKAYPKEIQTEHLWNANPQHYHINLLGPLVRGSFSLPFKFSSSISFRS